MKLSAKIGIIQLTDNRLRIVVVKTGGTHPKVLERIDETLPQSSGDADLVRANQATLIRNAIKTLKNAPTIFMLNAPHGWSVMRLLSVPFKGAKKVAAAITFELEPYLAIPIDDLMIDHNTVSEFEGRTEVFIMGVQRNAVTEQLEILRAAGVTIEGIGLDIVGLSALSLETLVKDSTPHALVIEHQEHSYLTVVLNRSLAYVQRITAPSDQSDAWTQEIQNAIRAFQANSLAPVTLTRVLCTHADLPEDTRSDLEEKLGLSVQITPLATSWAPESVLQSSDSSTWLSMIGTGSSAAGGSFNISFDQPDLEGDSPPNPYKMHIAAMAALLLFTLTAHLFITHIKTRNNLAEIELIGQTVWEEFAATYPGDPLAQARPTGDVGGFKSFDAMTQALENEQTGSTNLAPEFFNQPNLLDVLKELSDLMPDSRVSVAVINITKRRNRMEVHVSGEIKDAAAFGKITDGIKQSNLFEIGKHTRSSIAGKENFDIVAYITSDNSDT